MVKNSPGNAGDAGSISGWGRSPGVGNSNALQYSCLGNPMDRGALQATVHGPAKESDTTEHTHMHMHSYFTNSTSSSSKVGTHLITFAFQWQLAPCTSNTSC